VTSMLILALAAASIALHSASASPQVSADDATAMESEALADVAPSRLQGGFDFMLEDPDTAVDETTGRGFDNPYDDCANTPIRAKRSDGSTVIKRLDVCDW
jgi:hypothetical protein